MARVKPTTKICKHCKSEIPYGAKVCPQCRKKQGKGVLGWILLAVGLLIVISALTGGGSKDDKADDKKVGQVTATSETIGAVNTNADGNETNAPTVNEKTVYLVGDILQDGDLKIVYISSGEYKEENQFMQPAEGKKYIFIKLAFENTSKSSDQSVSSFSFEAYADGYSASAYWGGEGGLSATLSPGRSTEGYLYFEVPVDAKEIEIEYDTNYFSKDKITFVYEGDKDSGYVLEANTAATEGALSVGDVAESTSLVITYLACYRDTSNNQFITPKEGHHYVTAEFEFENVSSSDKTISSLSFDGFADGIALEQAFFREDNLSATLSSGRKAKGTVTFEVPDDATTVEFEFVSNYWTSNRVVFTVTE